jgi:hypothetical protein
LQFLCQGKRESTPCCQSLITKEVTSTSPQSVILGVFHVANRKRNYCFLPRWPRTYNFIQLFG